MVAKETRRDYEYTNAQLSEATFTGSIVIKDGKLYATLGDITVHYLNGKGFTFNLFQEGMGEPMYNNNLGLFTTLVKSCSNVKEGMDDNAIIEEFKEFIKKDLGLID